MCTRASAGSEAANCGKDFSDIDFVSPCGGTCPCIRKMALKSRTYHVVEKRMRFFLPPLPPVIKATDR